MRTHNETLATATKLSNADTNEPRGAASSLNAPTSSAPIQSAPILGPVLSDAVPVLREQLPMAQLAPLETQGELCLPSEGFHGANVQVFQPIENATFENTAVTNALHHFLNSSLALALAQAQAQVQPQSQVHPQLPGALSLADVLAAFQNGTALSASPRVPEFLPASELNAQIQAYLTEFGNGSFAPRTTEKKRSNLRLFQRYMEKSSHTFCDVGALKAFFAHLNDGYERPSSKSSPKKICKNYRPSTRLTFYSDLLAFFNWLIQEETISKSPVIKRIRPKVPHDQIVPFSAQQLEALLDAAHRSPNCKRNVAILKLR